MMNKQSGPHFDTVDERYGRRFATILGYLLRKEHGFEQLHMLIGDEQTEDEKAKSKLMAVQVFDTVVRDLSGMLDADRSSFFLVDEASGALCPIVARGTEPIYLKRGMGLVGHVASTGEMSNVSDAYSSPWFSPENDKKTGY